MPTNLPKKAPEIRDLYPDLTDEQLREIEETLRKYILIAWRIFERLEREKSGGFDEELKPF